jgi:hypothetical protein
MCAFIIVFSSRSEIKKRLKKFLDGCEVLGGNLGEPPALRSTPLRVEPDSLGVVVVNPTLAHSDE